MFQSMYRRVTKTPLSLGRFLLFIPFALMIFDIFNQAISGKTVIDARLSLGFFAICGFIFVLSQSMITLRWINQTSLLRLEFDPDKVQIPKARFYATELAAFVIFALPVILVVNILYAINDPKELLLLYGVSLIVGALGLLVRYVKRKRSKTSSRIILSKVGMIYLSEMILWADLRGMEYIKSGEVVVSEEGNTLVLTIVKNYRYLNTTLTYKIPMREQSVEEINRILATMISFNVKG